MPQKIIVVDDDQETRIALFEALSRRGYNVSVAENGVLALEIIRRTPADMVITDIRMPEMDGLQLLKELRRNSRELPVLIITGHATVDTAVEAMKLGAVDYMLKPVGPEVIIEVVERVFHGAAVKNQPEMESVISRRKRASARRTLIGRDGDLRRIVRKALSVASSKATVLLLGETGTGKEVFARFIHDESDRRHGPFVALNCAALPENLLESELFGHEKGAFTGAVAVKKGKFEQADGGTLLLDEISEIPLHLQAKLLRVLQEEEVDRLGGRGPIKIDVHVLAASNRDLEQEVEEGKFRRDLYYRLNVIPLRLPALRERKNDIRPLCRYFIEKYSALYNKDVKKMSDAAWKRFLGSEWPGNVREMENLVERAVLLSVSAKLEVYDFWDEDSGTGPEDLTGNNNGVGPPEGASLPLPSGSDEIVPLKDIERQMIIHALRKTDDNRTHAARMLGISVRTLRNKLHEYRSDGLLE